MECLACHTPNNDGARFCAKCGAPLPVQKAADADPLIGLTIGGRYRIMGILGEGGMGRVYSGEQQMGTSVRKVAVKTLLAQFAKDPQTVARFMREVGTVSELEHPNTIKVFDFGQIEGSGELYIAMELLQGKSLDELLSTGQPLQPERVDRIIGQACGSLQEAHDKGVVHRDLKPANIFLTTRAGEEDVVKVLDFGIAKRDSKDTKTEQKLTQQGTILGTPPYMSPEQFTGKELDARSDVYSLGVVTFEMLTGRLPFEADTPWQWMTQHMSAQPFPFETIPSAANVPHKMRQAVLHALAKDPNQRPATVRDFFEELTLGSTRMSVVGLGAGGVGGIPAMHQNSPSTGMMSQQQMSSGRGASTQIGEPLFPEGAPMGPGTTAPQRTMAGEAFDPSQGMGHVAHAAVPTAGGQAYPAPPQRAQKSGGGGMVIIAIVAFLAIGGGVGGFWWWNNRASSDDDDSTASTKTKSSKSSDDDDGDGKSGSSSATASATPTETATASTAPETTASSSGTPETSASAVASTTTTTTSTATTTTTTTTTTTATQTATSHGPQPGIDGCCRTAPRPKKALCQNINTGIKSGKLNRQSALATLRSQGLNCN